MSKKSTCFNRAQVYDRSLAPMLITFVYLLAVLPEGLSKMGSRYIFSTKYLIFENERYLVEEYGGICTVRSSRRCISLLEKHVDLKGENA